jgi:hypothetical protein
VGKAVILAMIMYSYRRFVFIQSPPAPGCCEILIPDSSSNLHPPKSHLHRGTFEALAISSPMVTQSQKECPEQAKVLCQESSHSCCRVSAFRSNEGLCVFLMRDILHPPDNLTIYHSNANDDLQFLLAISRSGLFGWDGHRLLSLLCCP